MWVALLKIHFAQMMLLVTVLRPCTPTFARQDPINAPGSADANRTTKKLYDYDVVLVTYAEPAGSVHTHAQHLLNSTAQSIGEIDRIESWDLSRLQASSYWEYFSSVAEAHSEFLDHVCMLWLWKPWIIREALHRVRDGDFVVYTDASKYHVKGFSYSVIPLVNWIAEHRAMTNGVMLGMRMNYPLAHAILRHETAEYSPAFSIFREHELCSYLHRMGLCGQDHVSDAPRSRVFNDSTSCCSFFEEAWMMQTTFSVWQRNDLALKVLDDVLSFPEAFMSHGADQIAFTVWGAKHGLGGFYMHHGTEWGGWDKLKHLNGILAAFQNQVVASDLARSIEGANETSVASGLVWDYVRQRLTNWEIQSRLSPEASILGDCAQVSQNDTAVDHENNTTRARMLKTDAELEVGEGANIVTAAHHFEEFADASISFINVKANVAVYPYRFVLSGLRSLHPFEVVFVDLHLNGVAQSFSYRLFPRREETHTSDPLHVDAAPGLHTAVLVVSHCWNDEEEEHNLVLLKSDPIVLLVPDRINNTSSGRIVSEIRFNGINARNESSILRFFDLDIGVELTESDRSRLVSSGDADLFTLHSSFGDQHTYHAFSLRNSMESCWSITFHAGTHSDQKYFPGTTHKILVWLEEKISSNCSICLSVRPLLTNVTMGCQGIGSQLEHLSKYHLMSDTIFLCLSTQKFEQQTVDQVTASDNIFRIDGWGNGRFGNMLISLALGASFARSTGASVLELPQPRPCTKAVCVCWRKDGTGLLQTAFPGLGRFLRIYDSISSALPKVHGNNSTSRLEGSNGKGWIKNCAAGIPYPGAASFNCFPFNQGLRGEFDNAAARSFYLSNLLPLFPILSPAQFRDNDRLVVHLRSGDVFEFRSTEHIVEREMWQPPLAFYIKIIDLHLQYHTSSSILLVTEPGPNANPCIRHLLERYAPHCTVQHASLLMDFSTLISAKHLVLARSTFSWAAALMAPDIATVFSPALEPARWPGAPFCMVECALPGFFHALRYAIYVGKRSMRGGPKPGSAFDESVLPVMEGYSPAIVQCSVMSSPLSCYFDQSSLDHVPL